jgi:transposase InsO family protein
LIGTGFVPNHDFSSGGVEKFQMANPTTRPTTRPGRAQINCEAALALFFGYYNFCRVHMTLKTTPAVKAGLAERPWSVQELLANSGAGR